MGQSWLFRLAGWCAWSRLGAVLALAFAAGIAQAQSSGGDAGDPPDRVARLAYLAGRMPRKFAASPSSPMAGRI